MIGKRSRPALKLGVSEKLVVAEDEKLTAPLMVRVLEVGADNVLVCRLEK